MSPVKYSGTVTTHFEKITRFEKKNQSALNLGPAQRTLKKLFQSALNLGPALRTLKNFKLR